MYILSFTHRLLRSMRNPPQRNKLTFDLYDVVALRTDHGKMKAGDRGTIVHIQSKNPAVYAVEFTDRDGATIDLPDLPVTQLINVTNSDDT